MVRAHAVQIRHGNRSPSRLFAKKLFKSFLTYVAFSRADTLEMSSWQLPNLILPNPPPPPLLRRRHRTESIRQRSYKGTDEISVSRSQCMNIQQVYKLDLPAKFLFCKKPVDTYSLYYVLLIQDCGVFTCYLMFNCASLSLWWAKNYLWIRKHNIVLREHLSRYLIFRVPSAAERLWYISLMWSNWRSGSRIQDGCLHIWIGTPMEGHS